MVVYATFAVLFKPANTHKGRARVFWKKKLGRKDFLEDMGVFVGKMFLVNFENVLKRRQIFLPPPPKKELFNC